MTIALFSGGASTAAAVSYDNGASGLAGTDVQAALDELAATPPGSGVSDFADLTGLPAIPFRPAGKYAPLELDENAGWANGDPDHTQSVTCVHDASAGAVPSYTSAKKGSLAIVTVAGTLGGAAVAKGDLLMALRNNPTTAAHWAVISDCTAELTAAIEAAQGAPLDCRGITFIADSMANPDARVNIKGGCWGVRSGRTGLYQTANITKANAATTGGAHQATVTAMAVGYYVEPNTETNISRCTRLQMSAADAAKFKPEDLVIFTCDVPTPPTTKEYIREPSIVRAVTINGATSYVYLSEILEWHDHVAAAGPTAMHLTKNLNEDRAVVLEDVHFWGAPTLIGESVGWWRTMRGAQVSGTISGSGASRTITRTNHGLAVADAGTGRAADQVFLMATSGDETTGVTCIVTSVTNANTFVVAIPSTYDFNASNAQTGVPSSGTIYYKPVFGLCNNTTHHGGAVNIVHAPRSRILYSHSRLYKMAIRLNRSDFCTVVETRGVKAMAAMTDNNNGSSGRLIYDVESYACGKNRIYFYDNHGGRHPYTSNGHETSSPYAASTCLTIGGNVVMDEIHYWGDFSESGGPESHEGSIAIKIYAYLKKSYRRTGEESYNSVLGNIRGTREYRFVRSDFSHEGIVFRTFEQSSVGAVHTIDFEINNVYYSGTSNVALRAESIATRTNKFKVRGRHVARNCGYGYKIDQSNDFQLSDFEAHDISYAAGLIEATAEFSADRATISYSDDTRNQGARYGFLMNGAARHRFGVLNLKMGASDNPAEIFTAQDSVAGKVVQVGVLIVDDPFNIGMPAIVTPGKASDFTLEIGSIIYNGRPLSGRGVKVAASRIVTPPAVMSSVNNFTHNTGTAYGCLVDLPLGSYSGLAFGVHAASTALNVKMGLYRLNNDGTLTLVEAVAGGPYTEAADASKTIGFAANRYLHGPYVVALTTDQNQALKAYGTQVNPFLGMGNMIQGGPRLSFAHTYASALPSAPTLTYTEGSGMTYLGVVAV